MRSITKSLLAVTALCGSLAATSAMAQTIRVAYVDPDEWTNLASHPKHSQTRKKLAGMIPNNQHPGLKAQDWFDKYQK